MLCTRRTRLIPTLAALLSCALAGGYAPPTVQVPLPAPSLDAPVRELQLASAPDGSLVLGLLSDSGEFFSGRGTFTGRNVTAWKYSAPGTGGAWRQLGGALNYDTPRPASTLNLALDETGQPLLVWNENYGDNDVVVLRTYVNGAWTDWRTRYLGDDLPYAARTRAVALHGGEPLLAWGEYLRKPYGSQLTVRTWQEQGHTWKRGPAFNDLKAFSRTPALAVNAAGEYIVAWLQGEVLESNLYASRWNGERWQPLSGSLNRHPGNYLASTRMVLDRAGQPIVAWLEDLNGQDTLYASRWNGQRWVPLGGAVSTHYASAPALALGTDGNPLLTWVEEKNGLGEIRAARWNGQGWQDFGVLNLDDRRDARSPGVAAQPDGSVILAWREDVGGKYQVQVRRLEP